MTEKQFRGKVTWFSFAFSLLVIWVHSYNAELFLRAHGTYSVKIDFQLPDKCEISGVYTVTVVLAYSDHLEEPSEAPSVAE